MNKPDSSIEQTSKKTTQQNSAGDVKYRCVCGQVLEVKQGKGICKSCRRKYHLKPKQAQAETVIFDPGQAEPEGKFTLHLAEEAQENHEEKTDPLIGKKLGHFKIISCLGGGGMGKVYRANDESLDRHVALKVIHRSVKINSAQSLQNLFQEARAQARLNHPHVAHIYYVGIESQTPFLAMELVGTSTLADRLKTGALRFDETIRLTIQIAEALDQAARFDIVHGDVKPANVLMVDDKIMVVKLSDFGMAKRISELKGHTDTISGTPNYIPPEATRGDKFDHRGDMYSLGITLFEMTFARLPYDIVGKSMTEKIKAHRKAKIEFPEIWPSQLPVELRSIIEKLLKKQPEERYDNFSELVVDLKKIEPVSLPTARPLLRALAWSFDSFLILSVAIFLTNLLNLAGENYIPATVAEIVRLSLTGLFLLTVGTIQGWRGSTPGKSLFQIRIVDRNGLRPGKSALVPRTIFQFLWAWGLITADMLRLFNLEFLAVLVAVGVVMVTLIEIGYVLFDKGMSFHDRLFHTRVVLDAAPKR